MQKRAYLRIPVSIPAEVRWENGPPLKVTLTDLSTAGLGLRMPACAPPDTFRVSFRLARFSKPITISVEVKNRAALPNGLRLGCIFSSTADAAKERVGQYVSRYLNITFPLEMLNLSALVCSLDALLRVLLFAVYWYFAPTRFMGETTLANPLPLFFYLAFSFAAFGLSLPGAVMKMGGISLIGSMLSLAYAAVFLSLKDLASFDAGLRGTRDWILGLVLQAQLLEIVLAVSALIVGVLFYSKIVFVADVIKSEFRAGFARA